MFDGRAVRAKFCNRIFKGTSALSVSLSGDESSRSVGESIIGEFTPDGFPEGSRAQDIDRKRVMLLGLAGACGVGRGVGREVFLWTHVVYFE